MGLDGANIQAWVRDHLFTLLFGRLTIVLEEYVQLPGAHRFLVQGLNQLFGMFAIGALQWDHDPLGTPR